MDVSITYYYNICINCCRTMLSGGRLNGAQWNLYTLCKNCAVSMALYNTPLSSNSALFITSHSPPLLSPSFYPPLSFYFQLQRTTTMPLICFTIREFAGVPCPILCSAILCIALLCSELKSAQSALHYLTLHALSQ